MSSNSVPPVWIFSGIAHCSVHSTRASDQSPQFSSSRKESRFQLQQITNHHKNNRKQKKCNKQKKQRGMVEDVLF